MVILETKKLEMEKSKRKLEIETLATINSLEEVKQNVNKLNLRRKQSMSGIEKTFYGHFDRIGIKTTSLTENYIISKTEQVLKNADISK